MSFFRFCGDSGIRMVDALHEARHVGKPGCKELRHYPGLSASQKKFVTQADGKPSEATASRA
ncbi:hypothetical protein [Undibacterium sp.]|uniref:hypothetical protein n=1 Tax=Undibacterium sp. TaxID=1914977 RepID=UPI002BCCCA10|nr:hypothetical protein [Undibacterium sp.]HTD03669.1 hypothetical protein [Undibacterium sp.]